MAKWVQEEGKGGQAAPLLHHKVCAPRWPQWPQAQQPRIKSFCIFFYLLFPIQIHNGFLVSHKSLTPNETAVLQLQMLCWLYAGWDALPQNPVVLKGSTSRSASQFSRPMLNEELISILEHSAWGSKSNHQLMISNWKALAHMFKHVATLK